MDNNIEVKIIKCKNCEHGYQQLYLDDKLIAEGDDYHDNIDDFLRGFRVCLKALQIDYTLKEKRKNICKFGCD